MPCQIWAMESFLQVLLLPTDRSILCNCKHKMHRGTRVVSSQRPTTGSNMRRFIILDHAKLRIVKVTEGVRSEGRPPLDWGSTIARGEAAAGGRRMAGGDTAAAGGLSSCSWSWPRVGSGRGWHRTPVGRHRHRHQASSLSWRLADTQAAQD